MKNKPGSPLLTLHHLAQGPIGRVSILAAMALARMLADRPAGAGGDGGAPGGGAGGDGADQAGGASNFAAEGGTPPFRAVTASAPPNLSVPHTISKIGR